MILLNIRGGKAMKTYKELQEENAVLQAYKDVNEDFKKSWEELKEENRLFTIEAKKLVAQYSAKLEWQRKILQEIKEIAEENKDTAQYGGICRSILQKIAECEVK